MGSSASQAGQSVHTMAINPSNLGVGRCGEVVSTRTFVDIRDAQVNGPLANRYQSKSAPPSMSGKTNQLQKHQPSNKDTAIGLFARDATVGFDTPGSQTSETSVASDETDPQYSHDLTFLIRTEL